MNIAGMQRTSTLDFPGVLSCVLFTSGCNLDCFYCHNRQLIAAGQTIDFDLVIDFLKRRAGLLDGVVISGGEPTLQEDIGSFMQTLKSMGYKVKLDTNGALPGRIESIVASGLADYIAVDFKAPKDEYAAVCKADRYDASKQTIELLMKSEVPFEVRTTLYPGLTKEKLIELLAALPKIPIWRLNFYKLPKLSRAEDAPLFNRPALNEFEVKEIMPELLKVQPGVIT